MFPSGLFGDVVSDFTLVATMKISAFTTMTNPVERGDLFTEPVASYGFAEELVIVDGSPKPMTAEGLHEVEESSFVYKHHEWPEEFNWKFIGEQFQRGYEEATGDWVVHADLDFIFHEGDFRAIRQAFQRNNDVPAISFYKYQFILPDRFNLKSRLVIAVNKGKYGDRIRFDSGGDLCQPSLDGKELKPDDVPESKIPFYNYEKILKTKEQVKNDCGRMARAYNRHFGEYRLGGPDDEGAFEEWKKMTFGRFNKPQEKVALSFHPKFIQQTIRELEPEQFGYDGWGHLERNHYVA